MLRYTVQKAKHFFGMYSVILMPSDDMTPRRSTYINCQVVFFHTQASFYYRYIFSRYIYFSSHLATASFQLCMDFGSDARVWSLLGHIITSFSTPHSLSLEVMTFA